VSAPALAAELGLDDADFVAVDRVRHVAGGPDISLERSLVPPIGRLARAVDEGLVDGSLTATIAETGLVPALAEQWVDVLPLTEEDAVLLHRTAGEPFLHSRRVSRTADGTFVEAVDSLLDPSRFRIHMTFGSAR
jgi:GntR family transcriptional regulator